MRTTPELRKELHERLRPFIEIGVVEVTVATDGEPLYRIRPGVTEEELLAAVPRRAACDGSWMARAPGRTGRSWIGYGLSLSAQIKRGLVLQFAHPPRRRTDRSPSRVQPAEIASVARAHPNPTPAIGDRRSLPPHE
jgi:hypothetical protein